MEAGLFDPNLQPRVFVGWSHNVFLWLYFSPSIKEKWRTTKQQKQKQNEENYCYKVQNILCCKIRFFFHQSVFLLKYQSQPLLLITDLTFDWYFTFLLMFIDSKYLYSFIPSGRKLASVHILE